MVDMTDLLPVSCRPASPEVTPAEVRAVLARSILADGLDLVLDIDRSKGSYLVDARTGRGYLDMFTFFASSALGMNHPRSGRRRGRSAPSWPRPR